MSADSPAVASVTSVANVSRLKSVRLWKVLLVCVVSFICVVDFWALTNWERALSPEQSGTLGVSLATRADGRWPIKSLTANSPLRAFGAKAGDSIAFDRTSDLRRFQGTDELIGMTLYSGGQARHIEVRPAPYGKIPVLSQVNMIFAWATSALLLTLGLVIGWRRADSIALRSLSVSLMSQTMNFFVRLLPGAVYQYFESLFSITAFFAYVAFLYFALSYPEDSALIRNKWVRRGFYCYLAVFVAQTLYSLASYLSGTPFPPITTSVLIVDTISVVGAFVALLVGWRRSAGATRQRFAWLAVCTGIVYLMYFGNQIRALFPALDPVAVSVVQGVGIFAANCGLAYAVLRHRVLDFGFALNRALVFATTSLLLAALFILSGQIINRLIHFQGREQSQFVDIGLGVAIAMIARQVVRWVDPQVQKLFFKRWHDSAAKLARFRVNSIHNLAADTLQSGLIDAVKDYCGAKGCAVYQLGSDGKFWLGKSTLETAPTVLEPEHVVLQSMLRSKSAADIDRTAVDLPAALALPMMARGRLTGFVLLGEKPERDIYRSDEIKLLAASVQEVGLELELRRLQEIEAHSTSVTVAEQ